MTGETAGFSAGRHLETFAAHAPDLRLDAVLADPAVVDDEAALAAALRAPSGPPLHRHPASAAATAPAQHDPLRCAAAFRDILATPRPRPMTRGRMTAMAMTAKVKDELSRHEVTKPCCRKAEVAATLRFAGGLHIIGGRIVVEAELDTANAARRLRRELSEVYGHTPEVLVLAAGGLRKGSRYVVRVVQDGEALARQTGLIDSRGRPVRGLPPKVVSGLGLRRRGRVAWRLPRPRLAHRARPLVGARGDLPRARGGPRAGRRGPPAGHLGQGPRGARGRPGRHPRRRRHRRDAHPARRPRRRAGLGGAPHAPRGARHRQPAGQLRRRQPAPLGARGRGRRVPGSSAPWRSSATTSPTTCARPASCGSSTSRPRSRSSASWPSRR